MLQRILQKKFAKETKETNVKIVLKIFMDADLSKEIRRSVDTGKVLFGTRSVEKILLKDSAKLVIFSSNIPSFEKERLMHFSNVSGTPFLDFEGNALELGRVCGKPFVVSTMIVTDVGKSKILSSMKEKKKVVITAETGKKKSK